MISSMKTMEKTKMEKKNINWLGWAFFVLSAIVAFKGISIDVCHKASYSEPLEVGVRIEPRNGTRFNVDVDNHHKNY